MPFKKGKSGNEVGRPKGSENEMTKKMKTVKETVLNVFNKLQDDPETDLLKFAHDFPRDFHAIAAKLIPTEIAGQIEITKPLIIDWSENEEKQTDVE